MSPGKKLRNEILSGEKMTPNSELTVDPGEELFNKHTSKLENQIWVLKEKMMIASLNGGQDYPAVFCLLGDSNDNMTWQNHGLVTLWPNFTGASHKYSPKRKH